MFKKMKGSITNIFYFYKNNYLKTIRNANLDKLKNSVEININTLIKIKLINMIIFY